MKIYPATQIEQLMIGRWEEALSQYWDRKAFNRRHQGCPICGGKDRFRWGEIKSAPETRGRGFAICTQCGSHPGLWWFMAASGFDFKTSLAELGENFLRVEPDSSAMPARREEWGYPKAPRIPVDSETMARSYIQRINNDPDYDRKYWMYHDFIESILMFQVDDLG